jgi:hypothetical protein
MGLTALTSASSGLIISTITDAESMATVYTAAGATIETITTLGTYAVPTATKCRFKQVDVTNHPGLYEFQFADTRFAIANSKRLIISVNGVANLLDTDYEISLEPSAITSNVKKNQALPAFEFVMTDSTTHAPASGLTVTATRSLDGGAFAACANSPASVANGTYKLDLAATDLNANVVTLRLAATGADDLNITLVTQP